MFRFCGQKTCKEPDLLRKDFHSKAKKYLGLGRKSRLHTYARSLGGRGSLKTPTGVVGDILWCLELLGSRERCTGERYHVVHLSTVWTAVLIELN